MLTVTRLREVLHYDPITGIFTWLVSLSNHVGKVAGSLDGTGRVRIRVDGREYGAHRLAWLYMTGNWPVNEIDHRGS
jgi:hypothetical protein